MKLSSSVVSFFPGRLSRAGRQAAVAGRLDVLDDADYPAYTTGRAADLLGVRQAFLRALDAAGAVRPQRTTGGRRRYSRRQLAFAARARELVDQGHTVAAAQRILALEDDLAAERALTARLRGRQAAPGARDG
jgi:MerR family transcriptional regulator, heat shock protein HspR